MPLRSSAGWVDLLLATAMSALVPLVGLRARSLVVLGVALAAAAAYAAATQIAFESGRVIAFAGPMTGLVIGAAGTLLALLRILFALFLRRQAGL